MFKKYLFHLILFSTVQWTFGQMLNMERVAQWAEGQCTSIYRRGDYTFTSNGAYLQVYLDKHDGNFEFYQELLLPAAVQDIWVNSNMRDIFVACGPAGLQIVQMDTLNDTLTRIREVETQGFASGVGHRNIHVYVAAGDRGLVIVNVNNLFNPYIEGQYATANPARDVWVVGDTLALLAVDVSGLFTITTRVKDSPSRLDSLGFEEVFSGFQLPAPSAQNVFSIGQTAYVATGWGGLRIVDFQDTENLAEIGQWYYSQPLNVMDMRLSGSQMYMACGKEGVWGPINVSDPGNAVNQILPFPPLDTEGISNRIWLEGDTAYVCDGPNGLVLASIEEGAQVDTVRTLKASDLAYEVDSDDQFAYVAAGRAGLKILNLNINDETEDHLAIHGEYDTPGEVRGLMVQDGFAFLADGSRGLHIVDVYNPAIPTMYGQYWNSETDTCYDVAVYNEDGSSYALLAYGKIGMMVVDYSGFEFIKKHEINTPGIARKIKVQENRAFLADSSGVYVYNIIDLPGIPVQINALTNDIEALSLDVIGDSVFVANGRYGFLVWNILTNAVTRVPVSDAMITDIQIKDKTIYLTDSEYGVHVYDYSTPGTFTETGYYETKETPLGIDISSYLGYILLADGNDGIHVLTSAIQPDIAMHPQSPIEFGPVPPGESRPRILRFVNEGSTLLRIENIQWLNGYFSFSQRAFSVAPGDTHQVVVRFSPTAGFSELTQIDKAFIYTNDPDESTLEITLQGRIAQISNEGPYERDEFTIGLYHMDDGDVSATLQDASVYEKEAIVQGSPVQTDSRSGLNKALVLDGESDYAYIPYHEALNFSDSPFTAELWFNISEKPENYAVLLRRGNDANRQMELALDNQTGKGIIGSVWDIYGTQHTIASGTINIFNNEQWYHIALTWDTDSLRLYLNGDQVAEKYMPNQLRSQTSEPMAIGATSTGYIPFNGIIDEVHLSSTARQEWEFHVNRARIAIEPSVVEFGNVLFGKSRTVPVNIANRGSQLLTVYNVYTSYGSVDIDVDLPVSLPPGGNTTFWMTYSPQLEIDHADSHVLTIVNSDPTYPNYNVSLSGKAVSSFQAGRYTTDPYTLGLYHFDDNYLSAATDSSGQEMDGEFRGENMYDGDIKKFGDGFSLKFRSENQRVIIQPESDDIIEAKWGGFTVENWFRMDRFPLTQSYLMRRGSVTANQFVLYVDNGGRIIGRMYNSSQDFYEVTSIELGALQLNQWYHVAMVQRADSLYLYINGNQVDESGFVGPLAGEATHAVMDSLSLVVGGDWGTVQTFFGNIDEIRISGIGRQSWEFNVDMARITVSPYQLNFGDVFLGSSRVLELTVNNNLGIDTLIVDTVAIDLDTYFDTDLSGFELAPGESRRMRITYTAADQGEHTGKLTFFTNDPFWPERNVDMFGKGIPVVNHVAYTADVFTLSLFHLDSLNEDCVTLADSSGNGIHGTLSGEVAWSDTGRFNGGLWFKGGSFEIPAEAVEGKISSYFTVESWFQFLERPDTSAVLIQRESGGIRQFEIAFTSGANSELIARIWNNQNNGFSLHGYEIEAFNPEQWYHVALSIDGDWARLMINGIVEDSVAFSGDILNLSGGTVRFGADAALEKPFFGFMDEMRLSDIDRKSWEFNVIPPQIIISDYQLPFEEVKLGFTRTLDLLIRNLGDQSLNVYNVQGPDTIFSIPDTLYSFTIDRLDSMYLPVSFKPVLADYDYEYTFTIQSNALNSPQVTLSLSGTGYANPGAVEYITDRYTLALYHFNESRGDTIVDASGNGYKGFLWNGARIVPGLGFYDSGVRFDGYNDRIEIPGRDEFQNDLTMENITIECYFRTDTVSQILVGKGFQDSLMQGDLIIGINSAGRMVVNGIDGVGPRVNDNAWHHMAFVYDSRTRTAGMYVDWKEVWSRIWDVSQPKAETLRPLIIGAAEKKQGGYSGYFQGYLDEFRFSTIDREVWNFNAPVDVGIKILTSTPAHPVAGDPLTLAVEVPVSVNPASVMIYYRQAGTQEYEISNAFPESDQVFKANIPEEAVTLRGLEYYIYTISQTQRIYTYPVIDPVHNPRSLSIRFETMSTELAYTAQRKEDGRYQLASMFSVPFMLENFREDTIFVNTPISSYDPFQWRLFWWDPDKCPIYDNTGIIYVEYSQANKSFFSFPPGRAYWLVSNIERNFPLRSGRTVTTDTSFQKVVNPGWNMIGNPFNFDINWSDCAVSSNKITPPYGWTGLDGYETDAKVLEPWKGYWIYNSSSTYEYIFIHPVEASLSKSDPKLHSLTGHLEESAWLIQLSAGNGDSRDTYNYAGVRPGADIEFDVYDRPEPPPAFSENVALYFNHSEWKSHGGKYAADIRQESKNGQVWDMYVDCVPGDESVQISWKFIQNLPDAWKAYLLDIEDQVAVDLSGKQIHAFSPGEDHEQRVFKIIAGDEAFVQQHREGISLEPVEFRLYPNAPNPFNPVTTLHYSLPRKADMELSIYNALGQRVRHILKKDCNAGHHTVLWDGTDNSGMRLASGIYICQLKAVDKVATRKMILIK